MSATIANLILLFASCVILSVFYWEVFHVVVLRSIRFRLFAFRDETRRLASERGLANSFVYRDLEKFICKAICFGPHISLISFFWFIVRYHSKLNDNEYNQFKKEAPPEFIALRDATAKSLIIIMMMNSPWVIFIGSGLIPVMWALGKLSKARIYGGAEKFVEEMEPDSANAVPATC